MGVSFSVCGGVMKKNNSTEAEDSLVYSPLCQRLTRDGTEVDIQIYKDDKGGWLLEIVDEFWNSTVWDDSFTTDRRSDACSSEAG